MFFRNLKDGKPKDQALRQAKLAYLREADPFKAHPANWATFVLLGDNKPLSTPANPLVWLILGGLALVLGILYYRKRKKKLLSQV
jgi:LPXTG-motif cell wall-anchored protein